MKRTIFILISSFVWNIATAQENVLDYYYPINQTVATEQVILDRNEYLKLAERITTTTIRNRYIHNETRINDFNKDIYRTIDESEVNNNSIICFRRQRWAGSLHSDFKDIKTTILQLPPKGKTSEWTSRAWAYQAKRVTIPTKEGAIDAIAVIMFNSSDNTIEEICYWCKGWGIALATNGYGDISIINRALFDKAALNKFKSNQSQWIKLNQRSNGTDITETQSQTTIYKDEKLDHTDVIFKFSLGDKPQITDQKLLQFINELKQVIINRDTTTIKKFLGVNFLNFYEKRWHPQYPCDNSWESFACALKNKNSKEWAEILTLIDQGCSNNGVFPWYEDAIAKYIGEEVVRGKELVVINGYVADSEAGAIIAENVNVRSAPSANSPIVGTISQEAIKVDRDFNNPSWVKIERLDKSLKGYIASKYAFTPSSERMVICEETYKYKVSGKLQTEESIESYLESGSKDRYILPRSEWTTEWKIISFRGWD